MSLLSTTEVASPTEKKRFGHDKRFCSAGRPAGQLYKPGSGDKGIGGTTQKLNWSSSCLPSIWTTEIFRVYRPCVPVGHRTKGSVRRPTWSPVIVFWPTTGNQQARGRSSKRSISQTC